MDHSPASAPQAPPATLSLTCPLHGPPNMQSINGGRFHSHLEGRQRSGVTNDNLLLED